MKAWLPADVLADAKHYKVVALHYILYSNLRPRSKRKSKAKQEICNTV